MNRAEGIMKKTAASTIPEIPANSVYDRIALDKLLLDAKNPRLAELGITEQATQFDLVKTLWEEMAVEEVAMSIAFSGYFDHEPLFVEPAINGSYVVIEGNRRLAAVKLLVDGTLRKKVKATKLPPVNATDTAKLGTLPVKVTTRKDSWRYLGFKHVNGPAVWALTRRRNISPTCITTTACRLRKLPSKSATIILRS